MRIYQPMLFLGLGGTGCKVGAEFERRLREELCGPDGTRLLEAMTGRGYLPYQLPSCLQFVYADLSSAELARVRKEVIPGGEHEAAARRTMRMITDLVPNRLANSAEVAQSLRLNLDDDEITWLPPREGDPRIGPLHTGAGQLPTVGRAVLFETLRRHPDTAVQGIEDALAAINKSGGDLKIVSGERTGHTDPINVFVVFSVAGGTGSGIFLDYLHLLGDVLHKGGKTCQIYPLVLMPSSFDGGRGGGRPAELNAGSSLIDLFRLVDDQNAHGSPDVVGHRGQDGAFGIRYPRPYERVELAGNTVQTAFLFGRPVGGVKRDDLARSMVSLMISLIGAGPTGEHVDDAPGNGYQAFADDFINKSVERFQTADTGVGRRGVSTSSVAALTTPLLELVDIVSSRLLANAVVELGEPGGPTERNAQSMLAFMVASGLEPLRHAQPVGRVPDTGESVGREAVMRRLTERGQVIDGNIVDLPRQLGDSVARMAHDFNPRAASVKLLREVDPFHLRRILFGHRDLIEPIDKDGFVTLLDNYRHAPPAPPGFAVSGPPQPHSLPRRFGARLRYDDPAVLAVRKAQDEWYVWRARSIWNAAWSDNHREWRRIWDEFAASYRAVVAAFEEFAAAEPQQFEVRTKDLYKSRVGVTYLLPPHERGVAGFYQAVVERLRADLRLGHSDREGAMLREVLGADGWGPAYDAAVNTAGTAVTDVRQKVKEAVTECIRPRGRERIALIPRMDDLLASAAGRRDSTVSDVDLRQFRQKLAALVPGGFAPEGNAPLKVLFTYPAAKEDAELEAFLRKEVALPSDLLGEPEFRAIQADSMVVVLMRTSMGITEVPEVRSVIKLWSEALTDDRANDVLPWRQRLGHVSDYLLMTERDRIQVLHRLLCAAWNGQLVVRGEPQSPEQVTVDLGAREAVKMELELLPLGGLSSWASLLQAYEQWILVDDSPVRRNLATLLMRTLPERLNAPRPPHRVFTTIVGAAEEQLRRIDRAGRDEVLLRTDPQLRIFESFWRDSLPAALGLRLGTTQKTLGLLPQAVAAVSDTGPAGARDDTALSAADEDEGRAETVERAVTTHSSAGVTVLDLRGEWTDEPTSGRVIVIDRADTLADHWDVYLQLAGDWLVSGVVCLALGEPGRGVEGNGLHSSVVLRVPAVLTNEKGAVLWVGDEEGVVWAARSDHAARVSARPLGGLDDDEPPPLTGLEQLTLALSVEEVFDAVRDRVRELPDRAASPGLVLFSGAPVPDDLHDACTAALSELTTVQPDRHPPVELHQALASLGVNPRLQVTNEPTGVVAAARNDLSVSHATADYLAGAVGSRWLLRARQVPGVDPRTAPFGEGGVRPGPDLAVWAARATQAAAHYRNKAFQLVNLIDGQLRRRDTTIPMVVEAGAPEPTQVSAAEVADDLADAVARHLTHDPALPALVTHLQQEAAAQAPAGCREAVAQLRPGEGETPGRDIPTGWPVSPGLAPVVLLTCAAAAFVPSPHWLGWLLGVAALLAWFLPAWLLLARWPMDDGERGLESAAASTALAVGLPGLAGIGLGLLGVRYVGEPPLSTEWRIGLVAAAFLLVIGAVRANWALAAHRVRKAVDLDPLRGDLMQVTALVGDVLRDEWVPSARRRLVAAALYEFADGLYEIGRVLDGADVCRSHGTTAATTARALPDGVARAVPAELQAVVRDDLVWIVRAALERARRATESGNPTVRDVYQRRTVGLLSAYQEHLSDRGLLTLPVFEGLREPSPSPTARDRLLEEVWGEAPRAREVLRMRDTDAMTQLCSGAQLGDLSTYGESVMIRFAPKPVRHILTGAGPHDQATDHLAEMVWTTRAELVGVLRLITLQPGAREVVHSGGAR